MPQNANVTVNDDDYTELTNADATNVTFQVQNSACMIKVATSTKPTNDDGAFKYQAGEGEINKPLSEIAPGATGSRLWARSNSGHCIVAISHA